MRLAAEHIKRIVSEARHLVGPQVRVWLFGSRVDDTRRGGDIPDGSQRRPATYAMSQALSARLAFLLETVALEARHLQATDARGIGTT